MTTSDPTAFVLRMLEADEAREEAGWAAAMSAVAGGDIPQRSEQRHCRVLAQCAAIRGVVTELGDFNDGQVWASSEASHAEWALIALASIWRDHEDYDEGWAL